LSIRIDVSEGTLLMISKVGIEEYCDVSQIGQGLARARHFSPGVTTDNDLRLSINMCLSSSLMLMKVSLFVLYWGFNCSAVQFLGKSQSEISEHRAGNRILRHFLY
jgi:hypothetical protein